MGRGDRSPIYGSASTEHHPLIGYASSFNNDPVQTRIAFRFQPACKSVFAPALLMTASGGHAIWRRTCNSPGMSFAIRFRSKGCISTPCRDWPVVHFANAHGREFSAQQVEATAAVRTKACGGWYAVRTSTGRRNHRSPHAKRSWKIPPLSQHRGRRIFGPARPPRTRRDRIARVTKKIADAVKERHAAAAAKILDFAVAAAAAVVHTCKCSETLDFRRDAHAGYISTTVTGTETPPVPAL